METTVLNKYAGTFEDVIIYFIVLKSKDVEARFEERERNLKCLQKFLVY